MAPDHALKTTIPLRERTPCSSAAAQASQNSGSLHSPNAGWRFLLQAFNTFLATRDSDIRRIARGTRGEHSFQEVISEAWLMAIEIGHRRGWTFDWLDQDDQDGLFARLYLRLVKYADKSVRYAVKLDHGRDDDERTGATLARLLTAPIESDPQVRQQLNEEREELIGLVQRSYSQATAYVLLLMRVDGHLVDLAKLLLIGVTTLRSRLRRVGLLARIQPSLFDGIETIDPDFAVRARTAPRRQATGTAPQPLLWPLA